MKTLLVIEEAEEGEVRCLAYLDGSDPVLQCSRVHRHNGGHYARDAVGEVRTWFKGTAWLPGWERLFKRAG